LCFGGSCGRVLGCCGVGWGGRGLVFFFGLGGGFLGFLGLGFLVGGVLLPGVGGWGFLLVFVVLWGGGGGFFSSLSCLVFLDLEIPPLLLFPLTLPLPTRLQYVSPPSAFLNEFSLPPPLLHQHVVSPLYPFVPKRRPSTITPFLGRRPEKEESSSFI